ncbi:MAG: RusA family crossover junction endodeoxyribonuclease [Candidatus Improbicoccus devescovinae]|nr:MAG: RusA family crossover junction endodeoxyribonuclease [Candidatus Improbicoccus devescovinae]
MKIKFTVNGKPRGKERPRICLRQGKCFAYTPQKTSEYEENIRKSFRKNFKNKLFEKNIPLEAVITAFYPIPKGISKSKFSEMQNDEILPTKKPDCDNVIKIILDALNGVCYEDDAQICNLKFEKHYSNMPSVRVEISEIDTHKKIFKFEEFLDETGKKWQKKLEIVK